MKSQLTRKDLDTGKDWRQKKEVMAEDVMVRQHHRLNGHEFEQTPGDSGEQRSLVCCGPWGHKELDWTATRPFRYALNQISYDYTMEVSNRFEGLDLVDRVPEEQWKEVYNIV